MCVALRPGSSSARRGTRGCRWRASSAITTPPRPRPFAPCVGARSDRLPWLNIALQQSAAYPPSHRGRCV
eukprot:12049403-Alexandrium_andersonii.AAC.1